ncbi:ATP-binding cassette domain-containing protein, partial [Bacillus sp. SIMBA_161]
MASIMKVEHLTSGYEDKMILNDISLEIPSNQISIIIGANGCGKSTL